MSRADQSHSAPLECRQLTPDLRSPLADFFIALNRSGDAEYFHPHPFTPEQATILTNYAGADLYYVLIAGDTILGYGMLRGWDAGYEVPSLGIAIHPQYRGSGLGKLLMQFLHCAARWKGATQIRLKVYPDNPRAIKLYQQLGYAFGKMEHEQLVGIATL